VFVEAAQGLARRVMRERDGDEDRLRHAFRCALVRPPEGEELEALRAFLDRQRARLRAGELDATTIAGALDPTGTPLGELAAGADEQDPVELAAWTAVARALLNLDEAVTKE